MKLVASISQNLQPIKTLYRNLTNTLRETEKERERDGEREKERERERYGAINLNDY